jgi:hypothetical protein
LRGEIMRSVNRRNERAAKAIALAAAAGLAAASHAKGQNLGAGQISISTSGSTALKNWFVTAAGGNTFTEVSPYASGNPGSGQLTINGTTYPPSGLTYWATYPGSTNNGVSYQLAPTNNTTVSGTQTDSTAAIQFTYHESGSVEGILELANDQIGTVSYVTANVDRNPEGGNAVWLNYNQLGTSGTTAGATFNAGTGASVGSLTLGNFYSAGVGQVGTPGETSAWVPGSASNPTPTFNNVGGVGMNASGGQNAVQIALSDAFPQQVFRNDYGNTSNTFTPVGGSPTTTTGSANTSFNSSPLDQGYGNGNSALPAGRPIGTAGFRPNYQSPSTLNMPAAAINPRTGAAFGVGAWNSASNGGLGNLNSQLVAVTATAFVANPGTGLTQVDRTDANWLETTGHLANGVGFNMTTRDVNSGTRDVAALDTGVDPSFAVGKNDSGNGTLLSGVNPKRFDQISIGPALRFSNKTAGGAQLRPTVENNRMAVGTLSINDAGSVDQQGQVNPVTALSYSDSTDGSAPYVSPNFRTMSNGTYVIYQNEVAVTVRKPDANYATNTVTIAANGAQLISGSIQGDDASGDATTLLNQAENSVATAFSSSLPTDVADGLLSQGYLVPSLMAVQKNINGEGLNNSTPGQIATGSIQSQTNPSYSASLFSTYSGSTYAGKLPDLNGKNPNGVTTGASGTTYGGAGGSGYSRGSSGFPSVFNGGAIPITTNNYLFGNFNQDGKAQGGNDQKARDFSAVKSALAADKALIQADITAGASVDGSEFNTIADNNANWTNGGSLAVGSNGTLNTATVSYTDSLGTLHSGLTKGDLIVMGDFNGDGHFDGADLVALAQNAAVSDSTGTDRLSTQTVMTGVLNKNAAMDYMNANVGNVSAVDQYIRKTGAAVLEGSSVPAGATAVMNPVSGTAQIDPVSGLAEFTYDPTGVNTFNKSDVQQSGVVDFNSAVTVDNVIGKNPANIADEVGATQLAPVTGQVIPLNLYMAQQVDGGGAISQTDVNVINTALTGSGTTNWYGYNLQKLGTSTISWGRTGGTVNVSHGASFQVSNGTVVVGGTIDPFSDNNAQIGNHVAVAVDHGAKLQITQHQNTLTVGGLTVDAGSGSTVDLGDNALIIQGSGDPIASGIAALVQSGFNGGSWNGPGINTSASTTFNGSSYALGYAGSSDPGNPAGLASGTVMVKYTLIGDADLNGTVNGVDFGLLAANFNKTVSLWDQGDFNYDGIVNGIDFTAMAANFNKAVDAGAAVGGGAWTDPALVAFAEANGLMADVPEPASVGLAVLAGVGILARRRRK